MGLDRFRPVDFRLNSLRLGRFALRRLCETDDLESRAQALTINCTNDCTTEQSAASVRTAARMAPCAWSPMQGGLTPSSIPPGRGSSQPLKAPETAGRVDPGSPVPP